MSKAAGFALVLALTLASGLFDARGFVYASRAWPGGRLDPSAAVASLAAFIAGVSLYVLAVRFMQGVEEWTFTIPLRSGRGNPEVACTTAFWRSLCGVHQCMRDRCDALKSRRIPSTLS